MKFDETTWMAIIHTRHCLTGCALGEIAGMAIGQNWNNIAQTAIGIILAFLFGYSLTFWGARRGRSFAEAFRLALAVDTVSILSMEIVDNIVEWLIPGAIDAKLHNGVFWWSEAISFAIAFVITVPVNRLMISKGVGHNHH